MCYGSGSWCLSTWKVSLVMLRAVETFWEIFRICKTPGFLQHSWRLSIGDSYTWDLRLFFREVAVPLAQVSLRDVEQFVEHQHHHGRGWATSNRRLNALKHFFDFCLAQQLVVGNPVKPSH